MLQEYPEICSKVNGYRDGQQTSCILRNGITQEYSPGLAAEMLTVDSHDCSASLFGEATSSAGLMPAVSPGEPSPMRFLPISDEGPFRRIAPGIR